ncbi:MAG TPA: IPT/TIG domain-containing protein [Terriglobales bacterium]|jgi:hypothetical protein|nr:IPT/TIG domain-containing protein [Terriglobales bacterium]
MMRFKWLLLICLFWAPAVLAQNPVLLFSDLTFGPNTGWNGSSTQGAAVTVWGKNFGATRGSSYITINGAQLSTSSSYAEWDAIGPARGLERITFWIPSTAATGNGNITVTVNGVTSNALPFQVAPATILFVDVTNGNNNNDGRTTATAWKDLWKWTPCLSNDPYHYPSHCNTLGDSQYIMYVRGGTYTTKDPYAGAYNPFIGVSNPFGSPTAQKAIVGYPGENPIIDTGGGQQSDIIIQLQWAPYGYGASYITVAKLTGQNGAEFYSVWGDYNRIVGNSLLNYRDQDWSGVIFVGNSHHTSIYGNLFNNCGYDSYKHNIYIKTQPIAAGNSYDQSVLYTEVGYNEFANAYASDTHGGVIFLSRDSGQSSQYIHDYTYIYGNLFHGGNDDYLYSGDSVTLGGHIYLYNNIFLPQTSNEGGLTVYYGTTQEYFFNNLFYQTNSNNLVNVNYTATPTFNNNIWWPTSGTGLDMGGVTSGRATLDHELWYTGAPSNSPPVYITNTTVGNPLFVSPSGNDFHIQSTSPARGAGINLYSTLSALPGGKYDYEGKTYPSSGAWDIGPLQYGSGSTSGGGGGGGTTPPAPPTGLTAVAR